MQHSGAIRVLHGMGAIVCETRNWETEAVDLHDSNLFSRGVKVQRERRCPNCDSIIYSRRHKACGVCAEPLPLACLFSVQEAESVERLLDEERGRHRKWLQRVNFEH
jgi:hypothetical protein